MFEYKSTYYNTKSAEQVVPIILNKFSVNSVLDVGCGIATWLKVFKRHDIEVIGVDKEVADKTPLFENIDKAEFIDLDISQPFNLKRKFDLLISLEVGEHIKAENAETYIKNLIDHSETIVFSAALPEQGGYLHINEQWLSYWIKIFEKYSFYCQDCIRPLIWNNVNVEWWYRQNIVVFSKKRANIIYSDIIHPQNYFAKVKLLQTKQIELDSIKKQFIDLQVNTNTFTWLLRTIIKKIITKIFKWKAFQ